MGIAIRVPRGRSRARTVQSEAIMRFLRKVARSEAGRASSREPFVCRFVPARGRFGTPKCFPIIESFEGVPTFPPQTDVGRRVRLIPRIGADSAKSDFRLAYEVLPSLLGKHRR